MSKPKRYLVMDIGCTECGEPSKVVGVFAEKFEAELAVKTTLIMIVVGVALNGVDSTQSRYMT